MSGRRRLSILVVAPVSPFPEDSGFKTEISATLQSLRSAGHEIELLAYDAPAFLMQGSYATTAAISRVLFSKTGSHILKMIADWRFISRIRKEVTDRRPDVVQVEGVFCVIPVYLALRRMGTPFVVRDHNYPLSPSNRYPSMMLLAGAASVLVSAKSAATYIVTTETDRRRLLSFGIAEQKVVVVPISAYNIPEGSARETNPRRGRRLVFMGDFSWSPNMRALEVLRREILPLVRREIPDAELLVVGPGLSPANERDGVRFLGFVKDLEQIAAEAAVAVVPTTIGGGMSSKLLKWMALGVPVVATPFAVTGTRVENGVHVRVESDWHRFAQAVVELLLNPDMAEQLAANARELVSSAYSPQRSGQLLEEVYYRAIDKQGRLRRGHSSSAWCF